MSVKDKELTLIIGYGYWGKKVHKVIKSLNQNIVIYDPLINKKYDKKKTLFIENINTIDPKNIIITTPVRFHYFYISKYLNKNKNILLKNQF